MIKANASNNYLIPPAQGGIIPIKKNASVSDTLVKMKEIVPAYAWQLQGLSDFLYDHDVKKYCSNIWHFVKANFKYKEDTEGIEELRTPARSWADRHIGIDCDCFSLFISSLLYLKGIEHEFRVVAWEAPKKWAHIYPVAYDNLGRQYAIDCIPEIPRFNFELKNVDQMDLNVLNGAPSDISEESLIVNGIDDEDLNGVDDNEPVQLAGMIETWDDDPDAVKLNGTQIASLNEQHVLEGLKETFRAFHHEKTQPSVLAGVSDVSNEYKFVGNIIMSWPAKSARDKALNEAINNSKFSDFYKACVCQLKESDNLKNIQGTIPFAGYEGDELDGYEELDGYDDEETLGRKKKTKAQKIAKKAERKRKFQKTKVGKLFKKVVNKVNKLNPITIAIRNGILNSVKRNQDGIAYKLIFGYLGKEVKRKGGAIQYVSDQELALIKDQLFLLENKYENYGGNKNDIRNAIMKVNEQNGTAINGTLGVAPLAVVALLIKAIVAKLAKIKAGGSSEEPATADAPAEEPVQEVTPEEPAQEVTPEEQVTKPVSRMKTSLKSNTQTQMAETTTDTGETSAKTTADGSTDTRPFFKRMWQDHKWWVIGGSLGLVLILILVIWLVKKSKKKKTSTKRTLAGRGKYVVYARSRTQGRKRRARALNGAYQPLMLAGPRKRTTTATTRKKRRR